MMNPLLLTLRNLATDLKREKFDWALVGGLAVSVHAEPRFTRDIDIGVAVPNDAEAEKLIRSLRHRGYRIKAVIEQSSTGRLATARLIPPHENAEGVIVDLLFASSGIEEEIVRAAEQIEIFKGLIIPAARLGHLVALKVLARDDLRRPQDLMDIRALLPRMGKAEKKRVEQALRLIVKRGFHRGKELMGIWTRLLTEQAADDQPE